MLPKATIGGRASAWVDGATTVSAGRLDVTATGVHNADATGGGVAIGIGGGAGANASSIITRTTEAYVGTRVGAARQPATLAVGTNPAADNGTINVHATSTSNALVDVTVGVVAGIGVAALIIEARVSSTTRAYVGRGATITAGVLDVRATSTDDATAETVAVSVGLAAVTGGETKATVAANTAAFVGTPVGETPGNGANPTTTVNVGTLGVRATSTADAQAKAVQVAVAAISVAVISLNSSTSGSTRAYIGDGTTVNAGSVTVFAKATTRRRSGSTRSRSPSRSASVP